MTRFTQRELEIIWDCLAFIEAGEIDGGPLDGESDKDTDKKLAVFASAKRKVGERIR